MASQDSSEGRKPSACPGIATRAACGSLVSRWNASLFFLFFSFLTVFIHYQLQNLYKASIQMSTYVLFEVPISQREF